MNLYTGFHKTYTSLHSQQYTRVFFPSCPHWQFLSFIFLIIVILIGVRRYLIVALTWISLMTGNIQHIFIYLLVPCISSLRNIYSSHLPILKLGYLFSCYWVICFPYRFQTLILYQIMLWNYFLSFQRFRLYSEALWCDVIPFAWFFFFSFVACAFSPKKYYIPKNHCPDQCQEVFLYVFF